MSEILSISRVIFRLKAARSRGRLRSTLYFICGLPRWDGISIFLWPVA
jgi:hypothetical protein